MDKVENVFRVGNQVFETKKDANQEVCRRRLHEWTTRWLPGLDRLDRNEIIQAMTAGGRELFHALEERFGAEGCE